MVMLTVLAATTDATTATGSSYSIVMPLFIAIVVGLFSLAGTFISNHRERLVQVKLYRAEADKIISEHCVVHQVGISEKFDEILKNMQEMSKEIKLNTRITESVAGQESVEVELGGIKEDALGWCTGRGEIDELLVAKANSMMNFFSLLLKRNPDKISIRNVKAEMQVQISKVNTAWKEILAKHGKNADFIEYFYKNSHEINIEAFFIDLCYLTNPQRKINRINVRQEMRNTSVKFFRHSLETLLAAWESYGRQKEDGDVT